MRGILGMAVVTVALSLPGARAQVQNLIEVCGDPNASPRDVVTFCQRALDTGELDARA